MRLTVCVDKVAASGGYMMAVVADTLIAAPFATVGSLGPLQCARPQCGGFLSGLGFNLHRSKSGKKHVLIPSLPPSLPPSLLHTFIRL